MMTFFKAIDGFRRWFLQHHMEPKLGEPPIKITIEVPTPLIAAAVIHQLWLEFEPMMAERTGFNPIDINQPMQIMGMIVEFKIKDQQPMSSVYRGRPVDSRIVL